MTRQTTQTLAQYVCSMGYDDIAPTVIDQGKTLCLSALGSALWGSRLRAGQIVADYVKESRAAGESGVIGGGFRTSTELAALANGTASHATELEDVSQPGAMYTCQIVPAVFALGEKLHASGKALLEALILGFELPSRVGIDCPHGRGWLHAPQLGTVGVAAACAKLLGLDVDATRNAMSIAASLGSGLLGQTGTEAHLLEAGAAGRNGVTAAMLAQRGLAGNGAILEGPGGYLDALAGRPEMDFVLGRGEEFRVMHVNLKKYPCCGLLQRIVDGLALLVEEKDVLADDVESVEVEVNAIFPDIIKYSRPANADEAKFSLEHTVAAVLLRKGDFLFDCFTDEAIRDREFTAQWSKAKMIVRPEFANGIMEGENPVTVNLRDGRRLATTCKSARGDATNPLSRDEVVQRFYECARAVSTDAQSERSAGLLMALDRQTDVSEVMALLTFASGPGRRVASSH